MERAAAILLKQSSPSAHELVLAFLAAIGLYGLISYSVAQRRQELGVRPQSGRGRAT